MKKNALFLIILSLTTIIFFSCSEGIFNFTEETGNISISFTADASTAVVLKNAVFNLSNSETHDTLKKDCEIYSGYDGQAADCYISRADTGQWMLQTSIYDTGGNIIAERSDNFELLLSQTVIAEFYYKSDGSLELLWEKPAGVEPESILKMTSLDTIITAFHYEGTPASEISLTAMLIAAGVNFDTALSKVRVDFPDEGFFEFDGGFARNINNIEVEANSTILSISRAGYSAKGTYRLTLADLNDVETTTADECSFGFDPNDGTATFSGTGTYAGGATIMSDVYEKNGSVAAGCYIVYNVDRDDGTNICDGSNPVVIEDPAGAGDLTMSDFPVAVLDSYVIIASIDADLSQAELNANYYPGITNLAPDNLKSWLYFTFGDRVNFIGKSVMEYTYP